MKKYGYIVIDPEGNYLKESIKGQKFASECSIRFFSTEKQRNEAAFQQYQQSFDAFDFEDQQDFNGNPVMDSIDDFVNEIENTGDFTIQGSDTHVTFEFINVEI